MKRSSACNCIVNSDLLPIGQPMTEFRSMLDYYAGYHSNIIFLSMIATERLLVCFRKYVSPISGMTTQPDQAAKKVTIVDVRGMFVLPVSECVSDVRHGRLSIRCRWVREESVVEIGPFLEERVMLTISFTSCTACPKSK
uniref:AlNc14C127G6846 protein n=1 Tax=Albugo laibachii Nc14 TaxID=890382 RepID=F0WJY0_9STRA|nr:AlNc14C127G6846 [Albugo laibachii Nc14]CCA24256.1 AlNc14C230G9276 [Albugo laibachii Nc14]|eukprot:CCA24256.1 AlNc14C230G9276 [Albugo laibachii Nc14]